MARHDWQAVPRPSRSAVSVAAGPTLGRTRPPSTFIDCPVTVPAGRRGRRRGLTRQTAPARCCRGPDRRTEPGRDLLTTVSGVMCMSTRRSRSGGRITVTSAAVARGSPVRAASQCSRVDGCPPIISLRGSSAGDAHLGRRPDGSGLPGGDRRPRSPGQLRRIPGQHRHHCVKAKPLGDEHYRKVAAQLMRTREIGLPPTPQSLSLLRQSRRTRGESLFSKLPPGVRYGSAGSMHKSLWDILGTLSPRPIASDHPLNCTNTGGRGGFQTPDRWCAALALTVERCPDKSHPCTSAAMRRLPASQPLSPVVAL